MERAAEQHLGAVGTRDGNALAGKAFRHYHDHAITLHRGHHRERVAGVAAGGFDDGVAGLDRAGFLRAFDDVFGDARLDRSRRIQEFALGEHAVQFQQRRVADRVEDVGGKAGVAHGHCRVPDADCTVSARSAGACLIHVR